MVYLSWNAPVIVIPNAIKICVRMEIETQNASMEKCVCIFSFHNIIQVHTIYRNGLSSGVGIGRGNECMYKNPAMYV